MSTRTDKSPQNISIMSRQNLLITLWLLSRIIFLSIYLSDSSGPEMAKPITNQPISILNIAISGRVPSTTLCNNIRALGNPTKPSPVSLSPGKRSTNIMCFMLILSGDIECNPGPAICGSHTKRLADICPCGLCDAPVTWSEKGIICDNCDIWYHAPCISMQSSECDRLGSTSAGWKCFRCDFTNADSSLYHSYNIEVSNSFSTLASHDLNTSVFTTAPLSPNFNPKLHSSPSSVLDTSIAEPASIRHSSSDQQQNSASASDLPRKAGNMRYLTINCNGIRNKKAELQNLVSYTSPDVIFLTETKIDATVSSAEFLPQGYKGFRKDRTSGGGGVMIVVRVGYAASEVQMEDVTGEVIWTKLDLLNNNPLYLCSFYRTPADHTTAQLLELEKSLEHINNMTRNNPNATIIVGGDFNAGDINWETNSVPSGAKQSTICSKVLDILSLFGLAQQQQCSTRENRILDLFCTNNPGLTKAITTIPGISDHEIICADCDIKAKMHKKPPRKIHMWSRVDWSKLRERIVSYRDSFLENCPNRSIEENYKDFRDYIQHIMDAHIPTKMSTTRFNVPWFNGTLKRMCKKKQRLYNKAKKSHNKGDWNQYKSFKRDTLKAVRRQRWKYIHDLLQVGLDRGDTKPFWGYVKAQRQDNMGVSPLKDGGTLHPDALARATILNEQFESVFTREGGFDVPHLHGPDYPNIPDIHVAQEGVEKLLKNLNPKKASGPDQITCRFLRELAT